MQAKQARQQRPRYKALYCFLFLRIPNSTSFRDLGQEEKRPWKRDYGVLLPISHAHSTILLVFFTKPFYLCFVMFKALTYLYFPIQLWYGRWTFRFGRRRQKPNAIKRTRAISWCCGTLTWFKRVWHARHELARETPSSSAPHNT